MELPVSLKIANTKGKILSTVNLASIEYSLPAFILEEIIADILSEVRSQAKIEALNDVNLILDKKNKNEQEDKE